MKGSKKDAPKSLDHSTENLRKGTAASERDVQIPEPIPASSQKVRGTRKRAASKEGGNVGDTHDSRPRSKRRVAATVQTGRRVVRSYPWPQREALEQMVLALAAAGLLAILNVDYVVGFTFGFLLFRMGKVKG